ncbi:MAG: hypothetical protein V1811_00445 [Candidatus Micrarchaeota archaeon]
MRNYLGKIKQHKHVNFATLTSEGIGAVHLKNPIPVYRLKKLLQKLGLLATKSKRSRHFHLKIRNKNGDLIATIVNLNLVLLPKYAKTKRDAIEFVNALLEHRP